MSNPTGKTAQGPLPAEMLAKLRDLVRLHGGFEVQWFAGVGGSAMTRALAGLPVRPATARLIELGLERLEREASNKAAAEPFEGIGR